MLLPIEKVFFADLGVGEMNEQFGVRPVLVIQHDKGNQYIPTESGRKFRCFFSPSKLNHKKKNKHYEKPHEQGVLRSNRSGSWGVHPQRRRKEEVLWDYCTKQWWRIHWYALKILISVVSGIGITKFGEYGGETVWHSVGLSEEINDEIAVQKALFSRSPLLIALSLFSVVHIATLLSHHHPKFHRLPMSRLFHQTGYCGYKRNPCRLCSPP